MRKTILILLLLVGAALTLSGCGHWGCWGGHNHTNHPNHTHYPGCGHAGY